MKIDKKELPKEEEFSYCIGRPWYPKQPDSAICVYAYGSTVFHGTMTSARNTRDFIESREDEKYSIYKLVKINE